MCLIEDKKATQTFLKKHETNEEVVVWKIYYVTGVDGKVIPPCCPMKYITEVNAGCIKSNRRVKHYDDDDRMGYGPVPNKISRGIHVYFTRADARLNINVHGTYEGDHCRVFRCTAKMEDLIAVGVHAGVDETIRQAVFMKIHITPEEFEKGKKGRN